MKNRNILIGVLVLVPLILTAIMLRIYMSAESELAGVKQQKKDMQALAAEVQSLRNIVGSVESRKSLSNVQGIVQAVDEVLLPIGMKGKVKSVKSAGTRDVKYALLEDADVLIEKVSMNEMINIFYKLENAPMALSIKRASVRQAFDDPTMLNITVTLSLIRNK